MLKIWAVEDLSAVFRRNGDFYDAKSNKIKLYQAYYRFDILV